MSPMKPVAKKALLAVGVAYVIVVGAMILAFVRAARPEHEQEVVQRVRESLNEAQAWAHEADPQHIREHKLSEPEAAEIVGRYLVSKGDIIGINYTLILQCLNFGVLLLLLYGLMWEPLLKALDQRRAKIKGNLDHAEQSRVEAGELLEQRRDELARLREERTSILDQAQGLGQQERREIVARAREEAERVLQQTHERLGEETRRAKEALRDDVAELATSIAAMLLKREVSAADHRAVIDEMIEAMEAEAGTGAPESGAHMAGDTG